MSKLPWFKFDRSAWLTDGRLCLCSPTARGIWIDLICRMDEDDRRGEISGTPTELAKLCRCTPAQFAKAVEEYSASKCADVTSETGCNGNVRIVNRRMKREYEHRIAGRERVKRFRNGEAASYSSILSSSILVLFELFWKNYPKKVGKGKCVEWFAKHEPDAELVALMVAAMERQGQWPQWRKDGGQFIPHPATWLNQGRWADEGMDTMQAAKQRTAAELMAEYEAKDEKRRSTEIH